jgi:hypothetical protein
MAQVVKHLCSKCKALNSNPGTSKKKKKKGKESTSEVFILKIHDSSLITRKHQPNTIERHPIKYLTSSPQSCLHH